MRMSFSYNLSSSHVHLLKDLLRADKRLELDEYKTSTGIGEIKGQVKALKEKNGQLKFPFLYFYLDKENYPEMALKKVFVVEDKKELELSEKKLNIRYYGKKEYTKRRIKAFLKKYVPFYNKLQLKKTANSFNY